MYRRISEIVLSHISKFRVSDHRGLIKSLKLLLDDRFDIYDFEIPFNMLPQTADLQRELFKINEKTSEQKEKGVYYTPEDVCRYIIWNSIIMSLDDENSKTYNEKDAPQFVLSYSKAAVESLVFNKTFFDPTCGSGEFLIHLFRIKMAILQKLKPDYTDSDTYQIVKTIYGNDVSGDSTDISKIRLFFEICETIRNKKYYLLIAKQLNSHFTNIDFVLESTNILNNFDVIIGNPPYVEYGKFERKKDLKNNFGNIYADVIKNSIDILKKRGVLGFIIPLSYISTCRMSLIRNYVIENTSRQFILNFADRPDCLFPGVHQKLSIVVAKKGKAEHRLYTSNYRHWYKEERPCLLNRCEIKENLHVSDCGVPKIGNPIEESIYGKIKTLTNNNIFDLRCKQGTALYLNMRACFWIKSFSYNPGSNEYKQFVYKTDKASFISCILNSSLFWLYWTMISDGWHITSKELKGFYVPEILDDLRRDFEKLSQALESKLEQTKKHIGTKQAEYEYKHKDCKDIIDEIDSLLAGVYGLSDDELQYVKTFAIKYRTGGGIIDKNN